MNFIYYVIWLFTGWHTKPVDPFEALEKEKKDFDDRLKEAAKKGKEMGEYIARGARE